MIAAADPQEFIPGGRQQALRHPGPWEPLGSSESANYDNFILHRLEKVSLTENKDSEWWTVRKVPREQSDNKADKADTYTKGYPLFEATKNSLSEISEEDSWSIKSLNLSTKTKRLSEIHQTSKVQFSEKETWKNDSRSSTSTIKSPLTKSQNTNTRNFTHEDDSGDLEEELYVKNNVVIWSKGLVYGNDETTKNRTTICTYSSQFPIKQALWCTFYLEMPTYDSCAQDMMNKLDEPVGKALPSIVIMDTQKISVYVKESEDFKCSMPFAMKKLWPCKFGLLIERDSQDSKDVKPLQGLPMIFSIGHPLDEVRPVGITQDSCHLLDDHNLQIVFVSEEPSICMAYDNQSGQHSVYKIRRMPPEPIVPQKIHSIKSILSTSNKIANRTSVFDMHLNVGGHQSPFNSRSNSVASVGSHGPSRSQSPMATISRCQSPAMSPFAGGTSPWLTRTSKFYSSLKHSESNFNLTGNTSHNSTNVKFNSLNPHICFEQVWMDNVIGQNDGVTNSAASKVFLSEDVTGQWYLCYLVPSRSQLSIVKFDITNITFGLLTSISALDAVAIPNLRMIAILEHSGNVVLYSGLMNVGKLHIGGVLAQHVPSPCVMRQNYKQFTSPFPRRSSLLPHCATPKSDPCFDEHLISPVLPHHGKKVGNILHLPFQPESEGDRRQIYNKALLGDPKSYLNGLRDAIGNRLTLQYSDGTYYRTTLPKIASSTIVETCINALQLTMPRDALITLITRWYACRNAPGPSELNSDKEFEMFVDIIFDLLGYEDDSHGETTSDITHSPSIHAKRQRHASSCSESDWNYLINSESYNEMHQQALNILNLPFGKRTPDFSCGGLKYKKHMHINTKSILFPYIRIVHFTLHLLYEDLKLNLLKHVDLGHLATFLNKLAMDLKLHEYQLHYWKDFPEVCPYDKGYVSPITDTDMKIITVWNSMRKIPECVDTYLITLLRGDDAVIPYPHIRNLNDRTSNVLTICGLYILGVTMPHKKPFPDYFVRTINPFSNKFESSTPKVWDLNDNVVEKVVLLLTEMGVNIMNLDSYPVGVKLIFYDALYNCREKPPGGWPADTYELLQRNDLSEMVQNAEQGKIENSLNLTAQSTTTNHDFVDAIKHAEHEQEDGMDDVESPLMKLRFADDLRVAEVRKLLQSAKPVPIVVVQRPDVSDHDFIEEQEKHLYAVCTRTMALPVGRGMFTLRTTNPVITEPLPTPTLCLTGKAPPRGTTVELTHIETPQNMNLWPQFHNGVANGLRVTTFASNINSSWIIFNKPKGNVEIPVEHGGFLMGLGLNGHLRNLSIYNTFDYLSKSQEMTSVGVLLGLATAFRGTSNMNLTKMISLHIEALLPPTSMELDISQNLQVASLLSIGLLYQQTAHRHMIEILLTEIGRPPGPEMENSVDRESYSLAAGLALGLVNLRQGGRATGISDLNVPDSLHYYMIGGNKRPLTGSQKDKYKLPSFQIREGNSVNLDVTAPGATLALGLMYLGSGNKAVADWMAIPDTQFLLDFVRPDFLMLRTISRALILWDDILPEKDWIESQIPASIRPYCMVKPTASFDIDYEAMNQAYCNIIAGACFALGLRYAGSADEDAFQTLLVYCHMFTSLTAKSIAELAGKPTIETCLNVVLLATSMVMAGTGNLEVMRIVRHLRKRVGVASSAIVTYGSHLAMHMALGLLFLGGGRFTLSNSPASVAALICAFYPKFPTHSNDNRYHLQAFRHLYVLAVEARLFIPKDVMLGRMCYAKLKIVKLDNSSYQVMAPCQLPDLDTLARVYVEDERYWTVAFERGRNWDLLLKILRGQGCIDVKQRVGCLTYMEDKTGFRIELAKTITKSIPWDPPARAITSFSSYLTVRHFTHQYLIPLHEGNYSEKESKLNQTLTKAVYDAVIQDKIFVVPMFASLVKVVRNLNGLPHSFNLKQFKLVYEIVKVLSSSQLISTEAILALRYETNDTLNQWEPELFQLLNSYLDGSFKKCDDQLMRKLALYAIFYDIPFGVSLQSEDILQAISVLQKRNISSECLDKVLGIKGILG